MFLLGYIPKDNRLFLADKDMNVVTYGLLLSVMEYQTAVMRRDFDLADRVLPTIPRDQRSRVAHFLESQVRGAPISRHFLGLNVGKIELFDCTVRCLFPVSFQDKHQMRQSMFHLEMFAVRKSLGFSYFALHHSHFSSKV